MNVVFLVNKGMRATKKNIFIILSGLLTFMLIPIIIITLNILMDLSNPLRQSTEQIRANMLVITPIGISMYETIEILESIRIEDNKNWGRLSVNTGRGVLYDELGLPSRPEDRALNNRTVIGEHSLIMGLGGYRNIFKTNVVARWAFDENKELISLYVQKQIFGW